MLTVDSILQQSKKLKVANGQWTETAKGTAHEWTGVCGKCGTVVPAVRLKLKTLPFGRGESWVCPEC